MNILSLILLPLLNVIRNFRRTAVSCIAIAFGITALVLFEAYFSYMIEGLRESMIRSGIGHIQIYKKGYSDFRMEEPENYLLSEDDVGQLAELMKDEAEPLIMSKQTEITGLISNGKSSLPSMIIGAEADNVNLMNSSIQLIEGDLFSTDEIDSVNLGQELARSLGAKPGDLLTLLASTADGYINAVDVSIAGIITTSIKALDERVIYGNLEHINRLYDIEAYSKVILLLERTEDTPAALALLQEGIASQGLDLEMKGWEELSDFYSKVKTFLNSIFTVLQAIIIAIVVFFISNTMIMNVMERFSEIGTIRALGGSKSTVVGMFLLESVYVGLAGGLTGLLLGWAAAQGLNGLEMTIPPPPAMSQPIPLLFTVHPASLLKTFLLCVLAALLSGIYPAYRASSMRITDALRHV